ncbi:MAG: hypothetical protein NT032_03925 [Actinobacteria bacterium]|nr:hypothetical protein [Actinomycetota bacterium]
MRRKITFYDIYIFVATMLSLSIWGSTGNGLSGLIVFGFFWLIGIPFRASAWATSRLNSRPCPVCGVRVRNGETQCGSCGTDFRLQ